MIKSCGNCGGLYGTEHLEAFAGRPCFCGSRTLPKSEYERGWNDCFGAVVATAVLRPEIVQTTDRFYEAVVKLAKESGVDILLSADVRG